MTTTSDRISQAPTHQVSQRVSQSVFDGSRLRVVLLVDVYDGAQQQFLEAYESLCSQVASVPGHVSDQLCQSIENPSQWLITSEWESAPPFLTWVNSEEHVRMVEPLHSCVRDTRSLRFHIVRETGGPAVQSGPEERRLQAAPRIGDGLIRHALTFTVKPGSEATVAKILAGYTSPEPRVDDTTRLCRTSLFMHGNRVVRAIEVRGDLLAALRHVARQPEVRAVEEAINPYLEQDRDLDDPESARVFFTRAALPAVHHVTAGQESPEAVRHALYYPAREGFGMQLAELLARQDEAAADDPRGPVLRSTIFQRDDVVMRLVDVRGALDSDPAPVLGLTDHGRAAELTALLDGEALGVDGPALRDITPAQLLALSRMDLVTDRRAPGA
ncbi:MULTISPECIES: SchA/CurD-like domain-containing protein [unclassified Streptomyces]|uniref:SchA/CurD-like domain-containing protein n=1 Tax=unclassified Streptomyces TaxID=2593676 RepID=UPI000F4F62C3|nr:MULTISPECIES: SchA/CurD-like domain-containing protein [unclassified Streptomyces]MDH6451605.1 heme-degrading monooxygenase HmoA [Streptomyces sp. SAI-119]MDH6497838.1 heme-degrading monooxygenase HmoA [Streptomyces sp. SAI-149]QUC55481.1 antibiotic biosynthesis monooxygenase [Streptomyces sp. A2-16]